MSRGRPIEAVTYITALISDPWHCRLRNIVLVAHDIMNEGVIFHIMKAIVTGHLLDFERLRRQGLAINCLKL